MCTLFRHLLILFVGVKAAELQNELLVKNTLTHVPICVRDAQVPFASLNNPNSYAFLTCPQDTVYIASSSLPKAGLGVFAARFIPRDTHFGPYLGYKHNDSTISIKSGYAWIVKNRYGKIEYYVDAFYLRNSNWLRFINSPNTASQENICGYQYGGQIMYKNFRDINAGEELLIYYGHWYAKLLGIDTKQFSNYPCGKTNG